MSENAQLDWDQLRIFLMVARTRRVASAARRLAVQHTTVSRRLAALERQLGTPLFNRTAAGYLLTRAGERILADAEAMEKAAATIGAHARALMRSEAGRVRIALAPEFASDWLAPHLPRFHANHPEIRLHALVGTRTPDLSRGEAELALSTPRPTQLGLVVARLGRAPLALYAARSFVRRRALFIRDAAAARGLPFLAFGPSLRLLQRAAWFQPVLAAANVVFETNGTHALLAAAKAGLGVAVLPAFLARRHADLVRVSDAVAENDMWMVTHPDFRRDPPVRATASFLREIAGELTGLP